MLESNGASAEAYKEFSARVFAVPHRPDGIDDIVLPPKLRDDPEELGADRWLDDLDWFLAHPREQYRWATGTGSDVALLAKAKADDEIVVRFAKRHPDPDQHVSIILAITTDAALAVPSMAEDRGGLDAYWNSLVDRGREVHNRREGKACPMAALARVSVREGQALAAKVSRTSLDSSAWRLAPAKPRKRRRLECLGLPDDAADANGEPAAPDTDRLQIVRRRRRIIVRTACVGDRQRAILFGGVAELLSVKRDASDWNVRCRPLPALPADAATASELWANEGLHLLRVARAQTIDVTYHMPLLVTAPLACELVELDQAALDDFWRGFAGYSLPLFYSGDNAPWMPHYIV